MKNKEVNSRKRQSCSISKGLLSSKKLLHRALNQLYPIECPDDEVITKTEVTPTELAENFSDTNGQLHPDNHKEGSDSDVEHEKIQLNSEKRPTRQATIAAMQKLKSWLNPEVDEDDSIWAGSVMDNAK